MIKKIKQNLVFQPEKMNSKKLNKDILLVTYIFMGLFLVLAVYFFYLAGFSSRKMINNSYNKLQNLLSESVIRGNIYSSDGELLAATVYDEKGGEYRRYPFSEQYCHIVGSVDQGLYGLEAAYNFELLSSGSSMFTKIVNDFSDKKDDGDSLITTLNHKLQKASYEALKGYTGAVVVMDSYTGAVLAMASNPGYNPNTIKENWEKLNEGNSSVLLNRASQGMYTPGSIFKLITLYEYLKEGGSEEEYSYVCTGSITVDGEVIHCNDGAAHGTVNLMDSFALSCNCSFVNIGKQLSVKGLQGTCGDLLFNKSLPIKIAYNRSSFSLKEDDSEFVKALTFFGQGETLISPLHAAILVSAVANKGTAMEPYFVESIKGASGNTIKTFSPKNGSTFFDEEMAAILKKYMRSVVEYGTAKKLNNFEHLTVYGKTGSAEIDSDRNINSWFIGFAEDEENEKSYTVVAVAENVASGTSPAPSVSIANQILKVLD